MNIFVVSNVVSEIRHRGWIDRRYPDCVNAQPLKIIQAANNTNEITYTVIVGILERSWIDLINNSLLPPQKFCLTHSRCLISPEVKNTVPAIIARFAEEIFWAGLRDQADLSQIQDRKRLLKREFLDDVTRATELVDDEEYIAYINTDGPIEVLIKRNLMTQRFVVSVEGEPQQFAIAIENW